MHTKRKSAQKTGYLRLPALILSLLVGASLLAGRVSGAALFSAGLLMPQSAVLALREGDIPPELQTTDGGTTLADVQETRGNAASQQETAQTSSEPSGETTQRTASTKADDAKIPADIRALITQAQAASKGQKQLGKILEKDYARAGVTHSYRNVRLKSTSTTQSPNIEKLLAKPPELVIRDRKKPAVLIFHTHTTESYQQLARGYYTAADVTRSNQAGENMIRVGEELAKALEQAGWQVIHDKTVHDRSYTGAYDRSRETVKKQLAAHPEIQVVLDVHRDAMHQSGGSKIKPTATINGKKAAQIMLISGVQEGAVKNFPDWEKNLRFALQFQRAMENASPGLTRPILFSPRLYTMNLHPNNVLVEVGSDVNTLDEAVYAARLAGMALAELLAQYEK